MISIIYDFVESLAAKYKEETPSGLTMVNLLPFRATTKRPLDIFLITVNILVQERHQDVVQVSNTCGRENRETGETVTLMAAQLKKKN